jgi:hypothetical protein
MPNLLLDVGIGAKVVQLSVAGSYISLVRRYVPLDVCPPIAYIFPFTAATPRKSLAVGIGAFPIQESGKAFTG